MFKRLVAAMGQPELSTDPAYATHTARGSNQAVLDQIIADWTAAFDREALGRVLDEAGVPGGDIFRAAEMLEDTHFRARQATIEIAHPRFGMLKMQNVAPRLSDTPGSIRSVGPELGEHNHEARRR